MGLMGLMGLMGPWLKPSARCAAEVAGQSHHGPSVLPGHGHQANSAANGVEILHEKSPPRAVGSLHDTALMGIVAASGILAGRANRELCTIGANAVFLAARHLCAADAMVAIGLVGSDDARLIGTIYIIRARAQGAAVGHIIGGDEIIAAVDLIHVMALAHPVSFGDDDTLGALHRAAHVGLQLGTFHGAVAVDGVDLAVVIE